MTFNQVVQDIKKLVGIELHSIRPGANITIIEIDEEKNNLLLKTAQGYRRSRPLNELKLIWEEMQVRSAVHVDEVLHGSGTSRNQPETILANLPYVEWLKITNKKHIAFVDKNTHPFGTLKQMHGPQAALVIDSMNNPVDAESFKIAIVTNDINSSLDVISNICLGKIIALEKGIYAYKTDQDTYIFLLEKDTGLETGTYCIINGVENISSNKRIAILGTYYRALSNGQIKALVKEK